VFSSVYPADTTNFQTIASTLANKKPDLIAQGAVFEDGVGLVRAMLKAGFTPDWFYQTTAPSLGQQYADAIGEENTEGIMFAISHAPSADTPGNAEFVAKYKEMFDGAEPPEDAADAYAAGQVLQAAAEAVGDIEDQEGMADWLRDNKVSTILGDLEWNDDGSPNGDFLIGQWQDGEVQFVLPEEFATTDELVKGWKPGGAS
jgi:branched-chain amino acid transport system substrate-binding protein